MKYRFLVVLNLLFSTVYSQDILQKIKRDSLPTLDSALITFYSNTYFEPSTKAEVSTPIINLITQNKLALNQFFFQNLSNIASPTILLEPNINKTFDPINYLSSIYFTDHSQLKWLQKGTTYSHVQYQLASQLQQKIAFDFYKQITNSQQFAITFDRTSSRGLFVEVGNLVNGELQKVKMTNAALQYGFTTKSNNFKLQVECIANEHKINETGGITSDSLYASLLNRQYSNMPQNIKANNTVGNRGINAKATFYPERHTNKDDKSITPLKNSFFLESNFTKTHAYYTDAISDSAYYQNFYIASIASGDTSFSSIFSTNVGFEILPFKDFYKNKLIPNSLTGLFYLTYSNTKYIHNSFDTLFANSSLHAKISTKLKFGILSRFSVQYFLDGFNKNGTDFTIELTKKVNTKFNFFATITHAKYKPSINQSVFYGNHTQWNTSFDFIQNNTIALSLQLKNKLSITYTYSNKKNAIFYKFQQGAFQDKQGYTVNLLHFFFNNNVNKIYFKSRVLLTAISPNSNIDLPVLQLINDVSYQFKLYSSFVSLGSVMQYRSSFNSMFYAPDIHNFTSDLVPTSTLPLLDFYAVMTIKRFNFLLKSNNLQSIILRKQNYALPLYPIFPTGIQLGFDWNFFD